MIQRAVGLAYKSACIPARNAAPIRRARVRARLELFGACAERIGKIFQLVLFDES